MRRARQWDRKAWREIYDRNYRVVYLYLYCCTRDPAVAERLTPEVFAQAVKRINQFDGQNMTIRGWLQSIARSLLLERLPGSGVTQDPLNVIQQLLGADSVRQLQTESSRLVAHLRQAFAQLSEDEQQILILKFGAEMSTAEIAEHLGKSKDDIIHVQHSALNVLRHLLPREHTV